MDLEYHQAFLNTTYRVLQSRLIDIKINELHPALNHLENWAFITAWNPLPDILSLEENQNRNENLEEDIKKLNLKYSLAVGISEDEKWSEESLLIENMDLATANNLAKKYGQLAFVYGQIGSIAILHYTVF
jgi:hypothetical protein